MEYSFRFEQLDIWKQAIDLGDKLFDISDDLADRKKFRLAEQLSGACLSISNNIAEGSGSYSDKDFANFLNIARRSAFECANILFVIERRKYIEIEYRNQLLKDIDILARKISKFREAILKNVKRK